MLSGCRTSVGIIVALAGSATAQPIVEHFNAIELLPPAGWLIRNHSQPLGTQGWFQGSPAVFPAQATTGYLAANYQSVNLLGTISSWLILPERTLNNGDELRFWTRTVSPPAYADRLQVRLSTTGSITGPGAFDVGDFSGLLLDINPTYRLSGTGSYPSTWTQFTVALSGLPGPISGRLAFRYFVENAGENGSHADYVGIDSVEFSPGGNALGRCCITGTGQCVVTTAAACGTSGGLFAGTGTTCVGITCPPPPTGACCLVAGTCVVTSAAACVGSGGAYRGDGTACNGAGCPLSFAYSGEFVPVPDGSGSNGCGLAAVAEVFVPLSFPVGVVEAALVLQHTWQGDVQIKLTKQGSQSAFLMDRPGYPASAFGFSARDLGATGTYFRSTGSAPGTYDFPAVIAPGLNEVTGSWKPEGALTVFGNENSLGRWQLEVYDCAGGEFGELRQFTLLLTPAAGVSPCYANCDGSAVSPVLGANDFQCFLNQFAGGDPRANCDGSTINPVLTANDFSCFLDRFNVGCS